MKRIVLFLGLFFLLLSCNNDSSSNSKASFEGTWKLLAAKISDGGSDPKWTSVDNGYTLVFNEDGMFTSTQFNECQTGKYEFDETFLWLDFDCPDFSTGFETTDGKIEMRYKFETSYMILNPTNCIEECAYKFKRIK